MERIGQLRAAAVGRLNLDTNGNVVTASSKVDVSTLGPGAIFPTPVTSGALMPTSGNLTGAPDSNGRNTATLTLPANNSNISGSLNFAYYVLNARTMFLVETDARSATAPVLSGFVKPQTVPSGGFVNSSLGAGSSLVFATVGGGATIGQIVSDGAGGAGIRSDTEQRTSGLAPNSEATQAMGDPSGRRKV